MNILVNGKKAMLKHGFSFEYVTENRLFLGRDGYTLSIVFPLKGCPQNIEIFGHIYRLDADRNHTSFDCIIQTRFFSLKGKLSITKIGETEISAQFANGKCATAMTGDFDETYITDLDLGRQPALKGIDTPVARALGGIDSGYDEVALPWVNEDYPEAANNWLKLSNGTRSWVWPALTLSWQPYLVGIAERICRQMGYEPDFTAWHESAYRYLIVCNTLPPSWDLPHYARALPRWTAGEFFNKLELLMGCEFDFDNIAKTATMHFSRSVLEALEPVKIEPVSKDHSSDISADENTSCDYLGSKVLKYKEISQHVGKYYSCDSFIGNCPLFVFPYNNITDLIHANELRPAELSGTPHWGEQIQINAGELSNPDSKWIQSVDAVLYAKAEDMYFIMRSIGVMHIPGHGNIQKYILQPINVFGSSSTGESSSEETIDFVPVPIDDTYISANDNLGSMMFLKPGSLANATEPDVDSDAAGIVYPNNKNGSYQTWADAAIQNGDDADSTEYYDCIYVAFWDGRCYDPDGYVYPMTDKTGISQSWKLFQSPYTLRLRNHSGLFINALPKIKVNHKTKFSWLSDTIPSPRAIYHIGGKRYLCEKITATFTEHGMSQLLKGEFYPLLDD